jgi:hypothetical protein
MVYLIPLKFFEKFKKQLVEDKDYVLMDATVSENGKFDKYTNAVSLEGIAPPKRLVRAAEEDEKDEDYGSGLSVFKTEELEDKFFNSQDFKIASTCLVKAMIGTEKYLNVFVILDNKAYKAYGEKIIKHVHQYFDVGFKFVFGKKDLKNDNDKIDHTRLQEELSESKQNILMKELERKEKKIEKYGDKDKDKKKKHHKHHDYFD